MGLGRRAIACGISRGNVIIWLVDTLTRVTSEKIRVKWRDVRSMMTMMHDSEWK